MAGPALLADIGGTHVRGRLLGTDGALGRPADLPGQRFPTLAAALKGLLAELEAPKLSAALLAIAGPVVPGRPVVFTNRSRWRITEAEAAATLGVPQDRLILLNDLAAFAHGVPTLAPEELLPRSPGRGRPGPSLVLAVGTGFGAAIHVGGDTVLASEAGHMTLAASEPRQARLLDWLRERHGHVSVERCVSGPGLVALARAVEAVEGLERRAKTPQGVARMGQSGACPASAAALALFVHFLGSTAGSLTLALNAGRVLLAGGVIHKLSERLDWAAYRTAFRAKGRFERYLRAVPSLELAADNVAFRGLARLARLRFK